MHIVDRRRNPNNKSLENRQRFLRRAKALVQSAVKKSSENRDIKDVLDGGQVSIPLDGLREPRFYRRGGKRDLVLPGNTKYVEGDILQRPNGGSGGKPSEPGEGEGDDAFSFELSRDEFVDLFLDDLELPDLAKRKLAETESEGLRRAGYTNSGSPANIAINKTMRLAMARRVALGRPSTRSIEKLEEALANSDDDQRTELTAQIEALKSKARRIPYIDPIDIRYRRFETTRKPIAQAVMFCLMDVSGSMSEHMKDLAKRFYMLLYVFLNRRYRYVEIVFIRHTDRAEEVDERTFFHDPASGGTMVSSALQAMSDIIQARYRPADWNIYAAQASDGDNSYQDSDLTGRLLTELILPVTQFFAYLEVSDNTGYESQTSLWQLYEQLRSEGAHLSMRKVRDRSEIFPVFHDLFSRQQNRKEAAAS